MLSSVFLRRSVLLSAIRTFTDPKNNYCYVAWKVSYHIQTPFDNCFLKKEQSKSGYLFCINQTKYFHTGMPMQKIVPFYLTDIAEGAYEVLIKDWYVKVGDTVRQFDPICEVQSDKATVTITSRFDGTIRALHYDVDQTCKVGKALVDIEVNDAESSLPELPDQPVSGTVDPAPIQPTSERQHSQKVLTTPSVRRIAAENKINLSDIPGSGKDGRILKEDILQFIATGSVSQITQPLLPGALTSEFTRSDHGRSDVFTEGHDKIVPLTIFQKAMTTTMNKSNCIPHFTFSDELELTNLVQFKRDVSQWVLERFGVKLSFMPFFIKAASLALLEYPILNAHTDQPCENVIYKADHNIGIAMDTSQGLLVPNIKYVQRLSIVQIGEKLSLLQQLGSQGKLSTADLTGGSVTLSNVGSIGGTYTSPRILPPEVMIGGIGRMQCLPRFDSNGSVRQAHVMCVSWAADHRVIDGATVARFSNLWRSYLEDPTKMIFQLS